MEILFENKYSRDEEMVKDTYRFSIFVDRLQSF